MGKRGRPRVKIDWAKVDTALTLGANQVQVCGFCECSPSALQDAIQREKGMTFSEYREHKMADTNMKVTQKLLQVAMTGNLGAIIWWQKNQMGWSDRVEHGFDKDKRTVILKYGLDPKDEAKADE
jgi:hypothetical protein